MLATGCRVIQSCTANRNQLIHGSFVTTLSWHIGKSWSALEYLLFWQLLPSASNVNTVPGGFGLRREAKIVLTSHYQTLNRSVFLHEQTEIKKLTDCSMFFWVLRATHPLLPQLLFQRCQAAFLPQHAAVPPARRIHIKQLLCTTVLRAWRSGREIPSERSNEAR